MVGITEASAALSGIKAAYDMARGVNKLTDDINLKLATSDLIQTILDAQQHALAAQEIQLDLLKRISELEAKLAAVDDWKATKARYVLHTFPTGSQGYVLRDEYKEGETEHRLCANCFDKGERSLLQTITQHAGEYVECHRCNSRLMLTRKPQRVRVPSVKTAWAG